MAMARPVFERKVTGERNRDKIAASKRRACGWAAELAWHGGQCGLRGHSFRLGTMPSPVLP